MDRYADKIDEGIVPTTDGDVDIGQDDVDIGQDDELPYEECPRDGGRQRMTDNDDHPPPVPPPLIDDLDAPPRPAVYRDRMPDPGYPDDDTADRRTTTSGETPSLPTTPSPNATKRISAPCRQPPDQSPERHNTTLTGNHSPNPRDQATLPRDHASPSHDHGLGDMDDKMSAKNTIVSYKTDRTTRTIDPELRAKARKIYR